MGKSVVVVATATVVAVVAVYCFAGCQGLSDKEREQFCAFSNTWGCAEDCTKICEENTTICGGSCQEGKIVSLDLTAKNLKSVDPSVQNMKDLQSLYNKK